MQNFSDILFFNETVRQSFLQSCDCLFSMFDAWCAHKVKPCQFSVTNGKQMGQNNCTIISFIERGLV